MLWRKYVAIILYFFVSQKMPTNRIVILDKSAALLAMLYIYLWLFEEDLKEGLHGVHEKGSGKQGKWSLAVGDEQRRVTDGN